MQIALTCIAGVESLVKREVRACGYTLGEISDRLVLLEGDETAIPRLNISSRCANRVYLVMAEARCRDFDRLYEIVHEIDWSAYCIEGFPISVRAVSVASALTSTPALQRTTKKAIIDQLLSKAPKKTSPLKWKADEDTGTWLEHPERPPYDILILLRQDRVLILLDTTGEALHRRGYRTVAGEAPLKESLAASLIAFSGWRYKEPLYDFFCGSGTILVEAMMIAREMAPGMRRPFAFERWKDYNPRLLALECERAEEKEHRDRIYTIIGSDIDPEAVAMARGTIERAGMENDIAVSVADIASYRGQDLAGTVVSNPPYGERLQPDDLDGLYRTILEVFESNPRLGGGIITSYDPFGDMLDDSWTRRKLYNGGERCYWYGREAKK